MSNQIIKPHSDPLSSNSPTNEGNLNQTQNHVHSQMQEVHSFTPVKLADTFRRLVFTMEKGNTIMQGCTNAVSNLNQKVAPEQKQFLGDRKDKVTVELKCSFLQILNIDTVGQCFEAEVFVQAKWQEPALQKAAELNDKSMYDPKEHWIPRMTILNANGDLTFNRRNFSVHFNQKGYKYPVVTLLWRFKGKFRENLELEHFPFDVQDLTIQLSTERSADEVDFIEDQQVLSTVNTGTFQNSGEWNIYEHVETFKDSTTREYVSSTVHPILFAQCRVKRKFGFYMWNIAFIVALISNYTFLMGTEEPDKVDRMYNNATLLMTAFVFRMSITQTLPAISYLTYLDVYVIVSLVFHCLQIAENSLMACLSRHISREELYDWDIFCISIFGVIYFLFHIMFLVYIYLTAYRRRRLMEQKDRLYQAKRRHLERYGVMMKPNQADALAIKISQLKFQ
ncbi:hypothetical protein LOTGIDRAFT_231641 [Lottia gigantea]|uniref:Neurotransmitter-gated ion-channel ligand-binding domain-containing protein n=1 Tax=Lottia gigantea TaxID=225164 RepID=V4APT2_LOTGI|nr:hypothetical protein LOTGIDRAFT_231641 [Lottia gigantea]ESO96800.1 hypothetical protein LOTGIDRAFT_231641 [Lottia gigantea]